MHSMLILFKSFPKFTRTFIVFTLCILLYGYLCRLINIYFFWESKTIGWSLIFISIILVLIDLIRSKKVIKSNKVFTKIVIGFFIFILLIKGILYFTIPYTNAYSAAIQFLKTNDNIKNNVGEVKDIFLIPVGGMSISTGPAGESGNADLSFIVKGIYKYEDINLTLTKENTSQWQVEIDTNK
jgi:hypothetical protein